MRGIGEIIDGAKVTEVVALLKERKLPLIHEKANIEEVVDAIIRFEHSRLLYVVDDDRKLAGTISLGLLARHVFSASHEPQIHPRFLVNMITAETNVKEIPVLDKEKRVVADLTIVDLLKFLLN